MKTLLLAYDDYANLAHGHARALRSVGVNAECLKLRAHKFGYADEGRVVPQAKMVREMATADVLIVYHSHPVIFGVVKNFVETNRIPRVVAAFHSGSIYRDDPEATRKAFDAIGTRLHLTDQCEFMMRPGHGLHLVTAAVDVEVIRARIPFYAEHRQLSQPFVFGHFPSNPETKGTEKIRAMMAEHDVPFICDENKRSHDQQMARMSGCDVYIELFKPELNGRPYGCWGVTAFEAAALGRAVITQNICEAAYRDAYGCSPCTVIANTEDEFHHHVAQLSRYTVNEMQQLQSQTLDWVSAHHGMQATGARMKQLIYSVIS